MQNVSKQKPDNLILLKDFHSDTSCCFLTNTLIDSLNDPPRYFPCQRTKKIKNITKEIIEKYDLKFDSSTSKMFKCSNMIEYVKYHKYILS